MKCCVQLRTYAAKTRDAQVNIYGFIIFTVVQESFHLHLYYIILIM